MENTHWLKRFHEQLTSKGVQIPSFKLSQPGPFISGKLPKIKKEDYENIQLISISDLNGVNPSDALEEIWSSIELNNRPCSGEDFEKEFLRNTGKHKREYLRIILSRIIIPINKDIQDLDTYRATNLIEVEMGDPKAIGVFNAYYGRDFFIPEIVDLGFKESEDSPSQYNILTRGKLSEIEKKFTPESFLTNLSNLVSRTKIIQHI